MSSRVLVIVFVLTFLTFASTQKSRCKCKGDSSTQIKCLSNATSDDIVKSCTNPMCKKPDTVYVVYPSEECLAPIILEKCKQIKTVIIDDSKLCDCYCNQTTITVKGSNAMVECACIKPDTPSTSTAIIPITTTTAMQPGIFISRSMLTIAGSLMAGSLIFVLLGTVMYAYRNKLKETYHRLRGGNEGDRLNLNEDNAGF